MNFVAIDVETANADLGSICQVGLVAVRDSEIVDKWSMLLDPEDFFDPVNIYIHGINEGTVIGAPTLPQIYSEISAKATGQVLVSHTSFDRIAITRAAEKYDLPALPVTWLDSARIVRRTWPDSYRHKGYGLANVAADLGIVFHHHDALEDARAAAEIVIKACAVTNLTIEQWLERIKQPINPEAAVPIRRDGNPEGALIGHVLVFTGALQMPRREAADLAATAGCKVDSGVTKNTTLLIVGDQDTAKLAGQEKSSKHRKAEALLLKGQQIQILRESDFQRIISVNN